MKKFLLIVMTLSLWACSSSSETIPGEETDELSYGDLTIMIKGDPKISSRSVPSSAATALESSISRYYVLVYNASTGACERQVVGDPDKVTLVEGLSTASQKRVVVIANSDNPANPAIDFSPYSYTQLMRGTPTGAGYTTPDEISTFGGLFMVGLTPTPVTLSPTVTTPVEVRLRRHMAKVILGTVTLGPDVTQPFTVETVSIQMGAYNSMLDESITPAQTQWLGGITTDESVSKFQQTHYRDDITLKADQTVPFNNYFYVMRNNAAEHPTLLCVTGTTYEGEKRHYSAIINPPLGGNTTGNVNGTYVQSNHQYKVNIIINDPLHGSTDPDSPISSADLEVEITVDPWELLIEQTTEI